MLIDGVDRFNRIEPNVAFMFLRAVALNAVGIEYTGGAARDVCGWSKDALIIGTRDGRTLPWPRHSLGGLLHQSNKQYASKHSQGNAQLSQAQLLHRFTM